MCGGPWPRVPALPAAGAGAWSPPPCWPSTSGCTRGCPRVPRPLRGLRRRLAGHRSAAASASLVFLGGFLARDISVAPADRPGQLIVERTALLLGWFVAANVAGLVARQRRAYLEQVEQRAIEAERTREEMALRRAGEERLRIARELHDSLTHSISVIKVQAGIAVHLARKRGEETVGHAAGDPGGQRRRDAGTARDPGRAARARRRGPRRAGPGGRARRADPGGRRAGASVTVTGSARDAARRGRPGRVPDRPGGADQRRPARRPRHRADPASSTPRRELTVAVDDDGQASTARPVTPGRRACAACGNGSPALGGTLRAAAARRAAGSRVRATFPLDGRDGMIRVAARRRPGPDAGRVPGAARRRGRPRGGRRGRRRDIGRRAAATPAPGRRAHGRPDAGLDGIEATRRIAADPDLAAVRVLILTNYGLDAYVFAALRAGASGFLLKDIEPADLLHAVAVAARGDALLAPAITRTLISEFVSRPAAGRAGGRTEVLTAREREIVELVARGLTNDEIAGAW